MEVRNFEKLRAGSGRTSFLDISKIGIHHESEGLMSVVYQMKGHSDYSNHIIEVRVKDGQVALFSSEYELYLPEYWSDAEVVYRWSQK